MGNELAVLRAMIGGAVWMREETRGLRTNSVRHGCCVEAHAAGRRFHSPKNFLF